MRLTDAQRTEIRQLHAAQPELSHRMLAGKYNCSKATIDRTLNPELARMQRERETKRDRKNRYRHSPKRVYAIRRAYISTYHSGVRGAFIDPSFTNRKLANILRVTAYCHWCLMADDGHYLPLREREIDHRIPVARGGTHSAGNVRIACHEHNWQKYNFDESEFAAKLGRRDDEPDPIAENQPSEAAWSALQTVEMSSMLAGLPILTAIYRDGFTQLDVADGLGVASATVWDRMQKEMCIARERYAAAGMGPRA